MRAKRIPANVALRLWLTPLVSTPASNGRAWSVDDHPDLHPELDLYWERLKSGEGSMVTGLFLSCTSDKHTHSRGSSRP